jgi:SpoVK/Ycf46/Vps4 family AAA+-type ATPase
MDEVDQAIGGRSSTATDGGVDARIFAQILTFTGDAALRGKVQFLMATNRPDLLDAAIIDRAGAKLIFLPPSRQDRIALLEHVAAFQKRTLAPDVDLRSLASHPSLSVASVRNLQEVVFKGGRIADMRAKGTNAVITAEALDRAVRMFNPGNTAELEFLALKCLELVTFYDELPWMDDEGAVLPGTEYPSFLEGVVDPATGRFAPHQLAARLREKEQLRAVRRLSS